MRRIVRRVLATLRFSPSSVCEESRGKGLADYHDYPDGIAGEPWHFHTNTCKRCGKNFTI